MMKKQSNFDESESKVRENKANQSRIAIEQMLLSLALKFIEIDSKDIDQAIEEALQEIAKFFHAQRCYIYLFEKNQTCLVLTHQYVQQGINGKIRQHEQVDKEDFQWITRSILNNKSITLASAADLPPKANTIKLFMEIENTQSMILFPLIHQEVVLGLVGLDTVGQKRTFSSEEQYLFDRSSTIFAEAIQRRKKAQSEILLEHKYKNLFAEIEDVVFISTPDGKFLEINEAGAKLFGYSSVQELLNIKIEQDLYLNAQDRAAYQKAMKIRGHLKNYELTLKRKDGKKVIVLVTATVVRNEQGEISAYQGILHDITELRSLEQQLNQSQKLESIGLLAGGVAHDFNNILTTIRGYAELCLIDLEESHPLHENVVSIIDGSKRAEELIRNLLAFSRKQMIEPRIIDINEEIKALHSMLSRLIAEDISFELNLNENLGNIKADPTQIQQILVNLIVNADHAIKVEKNKSKKRIIKIVTDERTMSEEFPEQQRSGYDGKYILIAVEDSGIGMDEGTKQKIFEPFYSTKEVEIGTGLGLSTVYGIVQQNKGVIHVESELGIGSIFEIYWPVTEEYKEDDAKVETEIHFKSTGETILLVEDDSHVRKFVSNALKSLGYNIHVAENGERALNMFINDNLSDKIDLVITDVVMPVMSGEELAQNINQINPSIKVILCSGYTDSRIEVGEKSHNSKYHFLPKPFTIKKLEKTIRTVLQ